MPAVIRALVAIFAALIALAPAPSRAQPKGEAPASETAIARRLFQDAAELREKGDWAGAGAKLREILEIKETAGVRFYLGNVLAQIGKLKEALENYDRAEALLRTGAKEPEVESALGPARETLRARIPTITVTCAQRCKLEKIIIDEQPAPSPALGSPIAIDPGTHRIEVHAAGRAPFEAEVQASEGDHAEVSANWPDAPGPTASAAPAAKDTSAGSDSGSSSTKTLVLVSEGGIALLGITLGLVFHDAARSAESRAVDQRAFLYAKTGTNNSCVNPTGEVVALCAGLADSNDSRVQHETFATVSFIAAGVGVGAIIATELLWKPAPSGKAASSLRLVAGASPNAAALGVRGALP